MEIIRQLPPYISRDVVKYLVPERQQIDINNVTFKKMTRDMPMIEDTNYCTRYELARDNTGNFLTRQIYKSKEGNDTRDAFLSRIVKKNGKHRYYLTFLELYQGCTGCGSVTCGINTGCRSSGYIHIESSYWSLFIGDDLDEALAIFFTHKTGSK